MSMSVPPTLPPVIPQNVDQQTPDMTAATFTSVVITGGTIKTVPIPPRSTESSSVIPGNTSTTVSELPEQATKPTMNEHAEVMDTSTHALPKIDIFMT